MFYHTDGAARPLLKPILDCGVDVLNPIQHACPGMDMAELKKEFGSRVIFHGGVDNQSILPRGTADQVRAEVNHCLRTLGAGREGFICCFLPQRPSRHAAGKYFRHGRDRATVGK